MRSRRLAAGSLLLALLPACSDGPAGEGPRGEDGRIERAADVSIYEVRIGDCVTPAESPDPEVLTLRVVPCEDPHTQEVFALPPFEVDGEEIGPGEPFPGAEVLDAFAQAACLGPFESYVGVDYLDSSLFLTFVVPSARSWSEEDDREIVCVAQTDGTPLTASIAGSGR